VVPGAAFVGSSHGDVYYWVGAPGWTEIPPFDRIWFATEHSAQEAGYRRATSAWEPLGELEIVREVGRGATSIVYHGRDRALGRDVAVKVVRAPFGSDTETEARFAQEARLLAALRHPNIVSAFAVKPLGAGGFALVMEYVRGQTLRAVLEEQGPLPPERVEQILRDVASALEAAHQHGIVHRDVKPDNVFIEDATGKALLADFGIALSLDNPTGLTMTGTAVGTPNYMSPEQIDGDNVDRRSDIYSLGLIGWEMLTGQKPWLGESLYSVIYKQKNERLPTIRGVRTDVPPQLAFAVERALAKDPSARWAGAKEFLDHLADDSWSARWRRASSSIARKRKAPKKAEVPMLLPQLVARASAKTVAFPRPEEDFFEPAGTGAAILSLRRGVMVAAALVATLVLAVAPVATRVARQTAYSAGAPAGELPPPPAALLELPPAAPLQTAVLATPGRETPLPTDTSAALAASIDAAVADLLRPDGAPSTPAVPLGRAASDDVGTSEVPLAAPAPAPAPETTPPPATRATPPLALPIARGESRIATGGMHSCGIDAEQTVVCWGGNDRGQLANTAQQRATEAVPIAYATGVQSVEAGSFHSCAMRALGSVVCWGENSEGQLGGGTTGPPGVARISSNRFYSLTLGSAHTCGVGRDGVAYCWGSNASGQLGDGTFTPRSSPTAVRWNGGALASLAAGWSHTCALTRDGRAFCWGDNARGQLGDGTQSSTRNTPTPVSGDLTFRALAAGAAHTCGVSARGTVYCWGQNASGQLGDGTSTDRSGPTPLATGLELVQVSAGGRHTCALDRAGNAYCWGQNNYGQLGNGTLESSPVPTRVSTAARFLTIRSSGSHTCAVATDGSDYCWGYNVEGQVGDGTRVHRSTPQKVSR
jgi:alpha-tubulin suppressor-like RCC1 family protein/tRNA A-37 threonylcarbamoyl transferase component Bud32